MVTRGIPYATDHDEALQLAAQHIAGFYGYPRLRPEPLAFTREAVLDALCVAPAPACKVWVGFTLSAVSGLARWVHELGQPLTREHVFDSETRHRYVERTKSLKKTSSRSYEIRLELVAETLNGVAIVPMPRAVRDVEPCPVEPLSYQEEADLWTWSRGLRPALRRTRVQGSLILGLGAGLMRTDKYVVRHEDVQVDSNGVHVATTGDHYDQPRVITCRAEWEQRLLALKGATPVGCFLMSPHRDTSNAFTTVDAVLLKAQKSGPPAQFNNVRLRNTWLCRHLEAGTPLKVLLEAADLADVFHLSHLLALMPQVAQESAAAYLRRA